MRQINMCKWMNVFMKWFEWSVRRDKYLMNSNLLLQMPQIVIFWQFWSPVSKLLSALAPHFQEHYNKMIVKVHCEHTLTTLASSGNQYYHCVKGV